MDQRDSGTESPVRYKYAWIDPYWFELGRDGMSGYRILPDGDTEWYDDDVECEELPGLPGLQELLDNVNHPKHYTAHPSGIEPIEIVKHETFLRGNVIKYVMRAPYKNNELEDLKKARQYLDWEIERIERAA